MVRYHSEVQPPCKLQAQWAWYCDLSHGREYPLSNSSDPKLDSSATLDVVSVRTIGSNNRQRLFPANLAKAAGSHGAWRALQLEVSLDA